MVGEQIADVAISRFVSQHPELRQASVTAEIPPPLKWAAGIIAGLFTAGVATLCFWLVTSVSEMQVTLGRMEERMKSQSDVQDADLTELQRRVSNLEEYHKEDSK